MSDETDLVFDDNRLNTIVSRLSNVEKNLENYDTGLETIVSRLSNVEKNLENYDTGLETIYFKIRKLQDKIAGVNQNLPYVLPPPKTVHPSTLLLPDVTSLYGSHKGGGYRKSHQRKKKSIKRSIKSRRKTKRR